MSDTLSTHDVSLVHAGLNISLCYVLLTTVTFRALALSEHVQPRKKRSASEDIYFGFPWVECDNITKYHRQNREE